MAEMNRFLRMCLLSFAALTISMGTANGQTRDSARISLSHRTLDGLATTFNDYAGFAYTAADLQQLQEQSSLLESSGHQAFLKIAHIVLSPYGQINEELEGQALSKLLGDKELLFYVYFASADLPRPAFSVAVVNSDMTEDEISGIEEYLAAAMQSHSEGGASMPDVMAHGIKLYLMMITSTSSFEYRAAGFSAAGPAPFYLLEEATQFIALSGVPIVLPAGSRAFFFSGEDSTRAGMLKGFKLPGSNVMESPFEWKSGTSHAGKFAGYGHWEGVPPAARVKFYSYQDFLKPPPSCNAPPYVPGEIVEVLLGFSSSCGPGQAAMVSLRPRLYTVPWADLSLPDSVGAQGLAGASLLPPPYRAANTNRAFSEVEAYFYKGDGVILLCGQSLLPLNASPFLNPLVPFPCGLDNALPASVVLGQQDRVYAMAYLPPDSTKAVAFIYGQRLHLAYEYYPGEILVVRYLAEYDTWEYINIESQSFLADAGIILSWAGEMAATAAPFVLFGVNFAVGAGASAAGFSARAVLLIDLVLAGSEAGVVYALTNDGQEAVQSFAVGALAAGAGTLLHKAIKAYKAGGYSPKLNAVFRFQKVESNGELGEAIKVDLASYRNGLRSKGWEDPDINKLFDDMAESEGLARYLLSDLERVGAWEALIDAPKVVRLNTSLLESMSKLIQHDLLHNIGGATNNQLANIHKYTALGDYLNQPMRDPITDAMIFSDLVLPEFEYQSYRAIVEGLEQLRQTSRLETGIVYRGRPLSATDFENLFGPGSPQDIPVKGFVSCTRNTGVAEAFAEFGFPGVRYRMIWNIKSTNGVDINDISDWGENLGSIYHGTAQPPAIRNQQEVLLEEGYYRKLGAPQPILVNGEHKFDFAPDGTTRVYWYEIELEELGLPIRQISN